MIFDKCLHLCNHHSSQNIEDLCSPGSSSPPSQLASTPQHRRPALLWCPSSQPELHGETPVVHFLSALSSLAVPALLGSKPRVTPGASGQQGQREWCDHVEKRGCVNVHTWPMPSLSPHQADSSHGQPCWWLQKGVGTACRAELAWEKAPTNYIWGFPSETAKTHHERMKSTYPHSICTLHCTWITRHLRKTSLDHEC